MTTRADAPLVLVTGSSSLIGGKIVTDLASTFRVVALDSHEPASLPDGVAFLECSLDDEWSMTRAITRVVLEHGRRVASVVHLAGYEHGSRAPSATDERLALEGTRRLVRLLQLLDVEQLVFSSPMLVTKPGDEVGDEARDDDRDDDALPGEADHPERPASARAASATERVLRDEHGDIPAVILRLAGAYDDAGHSQPLTRQIQRIRERELVSFLFPGDNQHGQPFVHVDDVASAFRRAIERRRRLERFEVFLIAEPEALSYDELQDQLGELIYGPAWTTLRIPAPIARHGAWVGDELVDGAHIDPWTPWTPWTPWPWTPWTIDLADASYPRWIERARQRLGWTPKHDLRSTLPHMVARLERDPSAFYAENQLGDAP